MGITHAKVSALTDAADTSKVRPSDWNAGHTVAGVLALDGIQFPATQVPSAGVNVLDDFEEGVGGWTPTLTFDTPGNLNVVYSVQQGDYSKIGRKVHVFGKVTTTTWTHTTASGNLRVAGLPFTAAVAAQGFGYLVPYSSGVLTMLYASIPAGVNYANIGWLIDSVTGMFGVAGAPTGTNRTAVIDLTYYV